MILASTKERLLQYIEIKGDGRSEFYAKTGMKRGLLDTDKLKATVPDTAIAKIIAHYTDLNVEWLLTGEGDMLKKEIKPLLKDDQTKSGVAKLDGNGIPLIPIEAFAGFGTDNGAAVMEYECETYVIPNFKGAEFLIQVKGSSMYPKYASGDIVACKKLPLDTFFQWNKVYVIDTEQGVLIKRVKQGSDADHVTLVSENTKYDPFELHRNEISSLAIVMGVIRLE